MAVTSGSLFEDFATYANGASARWASVIQAAASPLVGTFDVLAGAARFTNQTTNSHAAATLVASAGATRARVLVPFRFAQVRPGFSERGPGACLLFTANALSPVGFQGYRVFTDLNVDAGTITANYQAYRATGLGSLNNAAPLATLTGLTASTLCWLEAVVTDPVDAQGRRRFRIRMWKDGAAVPGWQIDALTDEFMAGISGPSGIAQRGANVLYGSALIEGNWPVHPTPPTVTLPAGRVTRGVHDVAWMPGADADAAPGDVLTYRGEHRVNGGPWQALFTPRAGLTFPWDVSPFGGSALQVRVATVDLSGLQSEWAIGPAITVASQSWDACGAVPDTTWEACDG